MSRISFRLVLPVVFVVVHTALVWVAATKHLARTSDLYITQYETVAIQEDGGAMVAPFPERAPLKLAQKVAILLDMPAFIVAAPIAAFLFPQSEMAAFYLSIPLVPFLWYAVGRWLDGILGYIQPLRLHRTLRSLIGVPAAGLLCMSAMILTPLYHHRTGDSYWVGTGMMVWSGLSLAIALSTRKAA